MEQIIAKVLNQVLIWTYATTDRNYNIHILFFIRFIQVLIYLIGDAKVLFVSYVEG